ncbi:MAG: SOS response-associated peptidase [Deltaproteobacteria bacterium]|jgi:putative SOS response-associated peptidase YedK|nr:SOS response-associated peptidase [Deltaproteobacteria bacterium]
MCFSFTRPDPTKTAGRFGMALAGLVDQLPESERVRLEVCSRDTYPGNLAMVSRLTNNSLISDFKVFGYPGIKTRRPIYNARSETADKLAIWKSSLKNRRCVVPAGGFYEYDVFKARHLFTAKELPTILLGAVYAPGAVSEVFGHFAILTVPASAAVAEIHDRMPVIIPEEDLLAWFGRDYKPLMTTSKLELVREQIPSRTARKEKS